MAPGVAMPACLFATAKRELAIIKAWLLLPAWKRLLSVPNLDKPAP